MRRSKSIGLCAAAFTAALCVPAITAWAQSAVLLASDTPAQTEVKSIIEE